MPRKPRIQFEGALYHVTTRGNNGAPIFEDERDREVHLAIFGAVLSRLGWLCHAFCLMGNHYHLLLETPHGNLAAGMHRLNGNYAREFNRRHGRRGHLFERRYSAILLEREAHLLEVSRYIVLNPVRAGLCAVAADWRWSSYVATAGFAEPPTFLTVQWIQDAFSPDRRRACGAFAEFVAARCPASLAGLLI